MKFIPIMPSRSCRQGVCNRLLLFCLLLPIAAPLLAADAYLLPGHPDCVALLPPPPAPGSAEEAADLESVRAIGKKETPREESQAKKDEALSFSLFAPAIGPVFDQGKLPKTDALLKKVKKEIGPVIDAPKDHWKRLRPYQLDETLLHNNPEPSFGYPSGHSTRGTVYSLVLAQLFPEKKEAILSEGRQIGWD